MEKRAKFFRYFVANAVLIVALVVTIIYIAPLVGGAETVDEPIIRGDSSDKVAIMFLVTRDSDGINDILNVLYNHNKRATFFVTGSWVLENSTGLRNIVLAGHELGNAGFFENSEGRLTATKVREEIELNHNLVQQTTIRPADIGMPSFRGVRMNLFLPIHDNFPIGFVDTARALGYTTIIGRNARLDTNATAVQILANVTEDIEGGDLLLMPASSNSASVLGKVLEHIASLELSSITARELLGITQLV
ncbi:MAG: polysaccharide deacetylase family protein [Firmicutes bacterium]|nr:polysaccharide deacetylase family protein [Bacillota bacterium]